MSKKRQIPTHQELDTISELFNILSEPMRLRILVALKDTELSVNEIVEATGAQQANISRHLSQLKMCGIVHRRKEGTKAIYFVTNKDVFALCACACSNSSDLKPLVAFFS